jgi:PAS domain S-box-containing protein
MVTPATPRLVGHVCIIGAADDTAEWLTRLLSDQGHTVSAVAAGRPLGQPGRQPPDVVLIDARAHLPRARDLLATLRAPTAPDSAAVVLLNEDPPDDLLPHIARTSADYLVWPTRSQEIVTRIDLALHRREQGRRPRPDRAGSTQPPPAQPQSAAPRQQALGALFQRAFEHLPLGALIVSPANQIEYVNEALCRFTGYRPEELIGRQPGFMVPPEDHAATVTRGHMLAAGQLDHFVQERRRYVRKDGSVALGKLTAYAPRDEAGRPLAFLAFVEDISSRVWAEDQLARYTRYQQALANASLTLLAVAPDERARAAALREALQQLLDGAATGAAYLFHNVEDPQLGLAIELTAEAWSAGQRSLRLTAQAAQITRLPYAALPNAHRERLLAGLPAGGLIEDIYAETPDLLQQVAGGGVRSTQTVPVHVDGQLWGFLGFDEYAEPRRWDHTDLMLLTSAASVLGQTLHRWQIEDDLRATTQFLHTTGHVARVGGWAFDVGTRAPTLSEELASLLEYEPGAPLDLDRMLSFYAPEAQPLIRAAALAAVDQGGGWELELPMVTASGRRIWVNSQGQAEQRDGRTVRLYGAVQDVTRRKEAELRLERQLRIEAALAKCSRELLIPVSSENDLRRVAAPALEYLRAALSIDQAYLMQLIPDPADPYLTMLAFATIPITEDVDAHPLARRFPLTLLPPARRASLEAGEALSGIPEAALLTNPEQHALLAMDHAANRLTLPIRVDGALWGVLGFNGLTERVWDEQEQTVLRTAAEMFSHVIRRRRAEDELRRSEEQFRAAVETMLDGFAIFDSVRDERGAITDFRYRYINEVGCQLNQRTREEQLGRTLLQLLPAHHGSELFADYVRLVETGEPVSRESLVYADHYGSGERLTRVFDVRAARLDDGFAVIWRDVTDRRLAHESLSRANDDLLRRVNELRTLNLVAQTLAFTQDLRAGLDTVCEAVAERTGATAAAIVGFSRRSEADGAPLTHELDQLAGVSLLTPDELGSLGNTLLTQRRSVALARNEPDFPLGAATLRRLGCAAAAYLLLVPLSAPTGNLGLLVLHRGPDSHPFSADHLSLAETMAGQIATAISNAQLGEQARRAAALAERNRVARDLHDSATQSLYSLVLISSGWAMKADKGRLTDIPAKFTQLSAIAVQVLKELRLLIYQLRHPELEAAGLVKALEERLAAVEQRANITTTLEVEGEPPGLAPEEEEQLYAMLQEALNNALRHGRASSVAVRISAEAGEVVFNVRDDGVGFDPDTRTGGLGLRSMQERAAKIGARLALRARPGQGTLVEIRVPHTMTGGESRV